MSLELINVSFNLRAHVLETSVGSNIVVSKWLAYELTHHCSGKPKVSLDSPFVFVSFSVQALLIRAIELG